MNLLVELFVEELPPKALKKLGEAFGNSLYSGLRNQNCLGDGSTLTTYASPRRLAAHITRVMPIGVSKPERVKLMPVSVALDSDGKPTPALIKKLQNLGLNYILSASQAFWKERISIENDGRIESLFHTDVAVGFPLEYSLQITLDQALAKLPIAKVMSYQLADGWSTVNFVRPAHGLVALHGADTVPVNAMGLTAGRDTQGHRFEAASPTLEIRDADSYEAQLETEGAVIASFAARRAEIAKQIAAAAAREKLTPVTDDALLDEVTALVERPNVLVGTFEKEFLEVPQECLILTMKANQKYFPLLDQDGLLSNKFLIVSNIHPADASLVIGGNERVIRPRLADAKFFYNQDRKRLLESRVPDLAKVVYHNKLGKLSERMERIQSIAGVIGGRIEGGVLSTKAYRAAMLAKADLLTDMVGEFPELQGIMGRYYAKHDGEPAEIADAIEDHYKPRFAGDMLPRNEVGVCVALADKLETLVGLFGIGEKPTGDKDPFALRRHALGVIRILIEKELNLSLDFLIQQAAQVFDNKINNPKIQLTEFIFERLAGSLREQGYTPQEVDAVIALRPQVLKDIPQRLAAVRAFAALPEAAALAAANKRVGNILKKSEGSINNEINVALLQEPAEQALHQAIGQITPKANAAFAAGDYTASLSALAALRTPVDAFFDNVMVNAEDLALRANRLALLSQLHQAMNRVADISKLAA